MPNIPALSKQRHRLSQIQGKLVLHREFQENQGYTVRFCPKKQNKQTRKKKPTSIINKIRDMDMLIQHNGVEIFNGK